ncbi:MAG: hypothetical protein M3032_08700 [Verrucomicrobiota bacterium]|nr:hypothetical protein [Verrucomicrobiota bacterium]
MFAKFQTARRLQQEIGGEIVFFFHDSDHDPRETVTILSDRHTGEERRLNFTFANQLQKCFSPLFAKRILPESKRKLGAQLVQCVGPQLVEHFKANAAENVADFCLEMYRRMALLDGIDVVRSSDRAFREQACEIDDCFVDVQYEGELVRARKGDDCLLLHKGGDCYIRLPNESYGKAQISPTRDTRLRWMQSVIHCTHYVAGAGEMQYLKEDEAPEVHFVTRDAISESDRAYLP